MIVKSLILQKNTGKSIREFLVKQWQAFLKIRLPLTLKKTSLVMYVILRIMNSSGAVFFLSVRPLQKNQLFLRIFL